MRIANNPDLKELDYITKVERILALRQDELLKPEGLRGNMYERWPFLIKDLLTPVYEAEKMEIIRDTQATQARQKQSQQTVAQGKGKLSRGQKRPSGNVSVPHVSELDGQP